MSPSEAEAVAPGLQFEQPSSWGGRRARGAARIFGVDFSVSTVFYWNTGLRSVAMAHLGDEDDATCRELASVSAAEFERAFGLATPPLPEPRPMWTVSVESDERVLADWYVSWFAARTIDCYIRIVASADPIPVPPPLLAELAEAEPIAGPPVWLAAPTREQVMAMHVARAERRSQGGAVELACRVNVEGGGLSGHTDGNWVKPL
jgi:hypothetical protein